MLRRRIALPVLSSAGLQVLEASRRYVHQSKGLQQFSYLPPGSHAPRMPWLRDGSASRGTLSPTGVAAGEPASFIANPAELDEILDASRMSLGATTAPQRGPLRATAACRMPVLAEPTLDTRIGDILNVSDSLAAERLPDVVRLLIEPNAEGVENVSLSDFAAMQPKRQLVALSGRKQWHEWLIESTHYKQVARLELESPNYDLRALRQAGVTTLYQWAEHPNLVKVSSCTRSLLDAAVEKSVEAYVEEVVKVVNTSNRFSDMLVSWVADTVSKFILETLRITLEQAAAQRHTTVGGGTTTHVGDEAMQDQPAIAAMDTTTSASGGIRPGGVCTLDHYHRLAKKVLSSVRKEYLAQRHADQGGHSAGRAALDGQAEAEIREKAYATLNEAILKVLESQAHTMPKELHALRDHGFLALERIPALLRQAASVLQLRNVPVRYFVFHSTGEQEMDDLVDMAACGGIDGAKLSSAVSGNGGSNNSSGSMASAAAAGSNNSNNMKNSSSTTSQPSSFSSPSSLPQSSSSSINMAAPTLTSGVFLAGTDNYNITLGEWPGYPQPPPSASSSSIWTEDAVQNEYFSFLHRLKRHTNRIARMTLYDTIKGADEFRNGFNAAEALGLQQLFGTAKLVEDRLVSVLNCYAIPSPTVKPVHFVEAGHSCGKTSVLERLSKRISENAKKAVIVRYSGATTPFIPGLDDHPLAFPSRFWFRVALASCPYLIRTEELFTRAPTSIMWWANRLNWSWELYQKRIHLYSHSEGGVMSSSLHAVLVDDIDRVLDAMEARLVSNTVCATGLINGAAISTPSAGGGVRKSGYMGHGEGETGEGMHRGDVEASVVTTEASALISSNHHHHNNNNNNNGKRKKENNSSPSTSASTAPSLASMMHLKNQTPFHLDAVETSLAKITLAVGQLHMVFTGHRASKLLLTHADAPIRRYFIPLSNGMGLQQRLRVLPLVSVLHALHQRSRLEFSGLMYEALKNSPGLLGYTIDVFWSGRAALMDLRGGAPRLMQWSGTHPLLRSYVPTELFAELPQRNYLLQNLPEARLRLVELLQRQLSSPTGYLTTGVDASVQDERDGFVVPYNHTTCQVHPFALFTIFTYQDMLESPRETTVVRAWGEVWAEYCAVVNSMGTTNERKRDALRVLLHGALLLRVVAVSGVQVDLNMKIPPYGFPLLASPTRVKQKGMAKPAVGKATPDTVRRAVNAYKTFFSQTDQTHIPFRPSVGLNGGCDVVCIAGTTLALYDIVTTPEALQDISYRFAESLLGIIHCLVKNVLPQNKIRQVHYVSVVSIDQTVSMSSYGNKMTHSGVSSVSSMVTDDVFAASPAPVVPYFLDLSAVFDDDVIDRLRVLQETLGISKEFRTLNDLLDELETTYHVYVHQDVVASQEELESLLSTTLMQLVPDATVLPAYTADVVSPDTLLMDLLIDDEEEDSFRGAEVEEVRHDAVLTKEVSMPDSYADAEHVQESAELLEALLNDSLIDSRSSTAAETASHATTQAALLTDIATEDSINNNMPLPAVDAMYAERGMTDQSALPMSMTSSAVPGQEDALAWLHDIVTPTATATGAAAEGGSGMPVTLRTTLSTAPTPVGAGAFVSLNTEEETDATAAAEGEEEEEVEEEEEEEEESRVVAAAQRRGSKKTSSNNNNNNKKSSNISRSSTQSRQRSQKQRRSRAKREKAKKTKTPPPSAPVPHKNLSNVAALQSKQKTEKTKRRSSKSASAAARKKSATRKR